MAYYGKRALRFGLAKESVRGTAEAAPSKWYPILPDPEIVFGPELLNDEGIRGTKALFAPVTGRKRGTGKFKIACDPQVLGEFLYSLLGGVSSAQQGGTAAYLHTFTPNATITPQSYTFFIDFALGVKKYNGCVVKSLTFTGPVDKIVEVEVEFLFRNEASGSIGSPSFPTQRYFTFQQVDFKIAGSSNVDVKAWNLKIDNGARFLETLALAATPQDIVAPDELKVTFGMDILFSAETERDKFIAGTAVAIRALMEGAVIASTYKWTVDLPITAGYYKAYPYQWQDNLLAAKVEGEGYHNGTSQIVPLLMNTDTAY